MFNFEKLDVWREAIESIKSPQPVKIPAEAPELSPSTLNSQPLSI
jgi:hypothetical protein